MRALYTALAIVLLALAAGAQKTYGDFVKAFDDAHRLGTQEDVDKVIKEDPYQAMFHYVAMCWDYKHRGAEETEAARQAVRGAWTRLWKDTTTLDRVQRFVDAQNDNQEAALASVGQALTQAYASFEDARTSSDRTPYERLFSETLQIARTFEELGDVLKAAETWGLIAQINDAMPDSTDMDRTELISALRRFIELRENWHWTQDPYYNQNKAALAQEVKSLQDDQEEREQRIEEGYAPDARGMEALVLPDAVEQISELKFVPLDQMEPDFFVKSGEVHMMWPSVALRGEDPPPEQLKEFKKADIYLTRPGTTDFAITTDGSMNPDPRSVIEVDASPRPDPSEFFLDAGKTQPYAMWFYVGIPTEKFMMAEMDMSPTRDQAEVFYRSAASWETTINDERVTFYDDNCDGILFSTDPFEHGTRLRTLGEVTDLGTAVPAYDSMRIGNRGDRVPFSAAAKIGDTWFNLRGVEENTKVGVRELNPEYFKTGEVKMVWHGSRATKPQVLAIQGQGELDSVAFDLSSGDAVEVPAGEYKIGFGRIVVGRGGRMLTAHIFAGDSQPFTVEEGATFELGLGEGFYIDFVREGSGKQLSVDSTKMRVLDQTGAVYAMLHGAVLVPEVVATIRADGRGAKPVGEFLAVDMGNDPILASQPLLGRDVLAFPKARSAGGGRGGRGGGGMQMGVGAGGRQGMLAPGSQMGGFSRSRSTTILTIELPEDGMKVGVRQLKHPLFGDLDPIFK